MYKRLLFGIALQMVMTVVTAQTRIMLISDPHVMGPGLLISEGEAWDYALAYDRKLNDYSRVIFDEAIGIAQRERPDLLLISGDLTKDGELLSHQYVVQKLTELEASGVQAYVIPGNHDMGTSEAYYFDGPEMLEAETINRKQFAELYRDFGYGADSERDPTSLTYACEPVEGLVLIGIDTGCDGEQLNGVITETTLNWVCDQAEKADMAGKTVLVMMHHSLFPHVEYFDRISSTYAVKYGVKIGSAYNYRSYTVIRDRLIAAGVRVVFSGHVHASDIGKDSDTDFFAPIYDVCTATCAACPNPYRVMELNEDFSQMRIRTRYITELPGVDDFPSMAEERMLEGLVTLAKQFTYDEDRAKLGADIFMLHVKGNENKAEQREKYMQLFEEKIPEMKADKQLQQLLTSYGLTFSQMEDMVYSMLDDKTNYGDSERESQVDDLFLTIDLREQGWTAVKTVARDTTDAACYTLQGLRVKDLSPKGIYICGGRLFVNK